MVRRRIPRLHARKGTRSRFRRFALLLLGLWLVAGRPLPDLLVPGSGVAAERTLAGLIDDRGAAVAETGEAAEPQESGGHQTAGEDAVAAPQSGAAQADAHAEEPGGHGPRIRDVFFTLIAILVTGEGARRDGRASRTAGGPR